MFEFHGISVNATEFLLGAVATGVAIRAAAELRLRRAATAARANAAKYAAIAATLLAAALSRLT